MLQVFRNYNISAFAALFAFSILIHLVGFIGPNEILQEGIVNQRLFAKKLALNHQLWSVSLAFLCNSTVALILLNLFNKYLVFDYKAVLIPYAFLLYCGSSFSMLQFSLGHVVLIQKVIIIYIIFSLYEMARDRAPLNLYILGFITGILVLIEPTNSLFLFIILLGVLLFKPSQPKDVFVFLLGFVVVVFFIFSIYFLGDTQDGIKSFFVTRILISEKSLFLPFQPFYFLVLLFAFAILVLYLEKTRFNIFSRKAHQFLSVLLLINLIITFINGKYLFENAQNFSLLFGIYVGHFLYSFKVKWLTELVNICLLIIIFWFQYDYLLPIQFEEIPDYLF